MQIVSHIKPRHAVKRTVTVNGHPYVFAKGSDGQFTAQVDDAADAAVFVASRHFHDMHQKPLLRAPREQEAGPTGNDEAAAPKEEAPPTVDPLINDEAAALIGGSATDIGRAVGNVSCLDVVRRAIELETGTAGKQRKGVMTLLQQALTAAEAAGVE